VASFSTKVVHVLAGRGLFQEIFGEEMCVITVKARCRSIFPSTINLGLAADVASVAGPCPILEDVNCGAVEAVMRVSRQKKSQSNVKRRFLSRAIQLRMNVNVVGRSDEGGLAEYDPRGRGDRRFGVAVVWVSRRRLVMSLSWRAWFERPIELLFRYSPDARPFIAVTTERRILASNWFALSRTRHQ